jgi:hypothetical protein
MSAVVPSLVSVFWQPFQPVQSGRQCSPSKACHCNFKECCHCSRCLEKPVFISVRYMYIVDLHAPIPYSSLFDLIRLDKYKLGPDPTTCRSRSIFHRRAERLPYRYHQWRTTNKISILVVIDSLDCTLVRCSRASSEARISMLAFLFFCCSFLYHSAGTQPPRPTIPPCQRPP